MDSKSNVRCFVFRINGVTATTPTLGIVAGTNYELDWRRIGSQMQVRLNGVLLHTFYYVLNFVDALDVLCGGAGTRSRIDLYRMRFISATINRDWSADGVTSGTVFPELIAGSNGTLTNFAGNPWKAEATINTIDNPIIPGK